METARTSLRALFINAAPLSLLTLIPRLARASDNSRVDAGRFTLTPAVFFLAHMDPWQVLGLVSELPQPGEDGRYPPSLRVQAPVPG